MKCGAILVYVTRGKKPLIFRTNTPDEEIREFLDDKKYTFVKQEVCEGKIIAHVRAYDEPFYGGTNAALEVEYNCGFCGNVIFPGLPYEDNISEWLTKRIAEL